MPPKAKRGRPAHPKLSKRVVAAIEDEEEFDEDEIEVLASSALSQVMPALSQASSQAQSQYSDLSDAPALKKVKKFQDEVKAKVENMIHQFKSTYDLKINDYFKIVESDLQTIKNDMKILLDAKNTVLSTANVHTNLRNYSNPTIESYTPNDTPLFESTLNITNTSSYATNTALYNSGLHGGYTDRSNSTVNDGSDGCLNGGVKGINLDNNTILSLLNKGNKPEMFAVNLFFTLFAENEILNDDCNVTGNAVRGGPSKRQFDPIRIEQIKQLCARYTGLPIIGENAVSMWKRCVDAIHKRISDYRIRKKNY